MKRAYLAFILALSPWITLPSASAAALAPESAKKEALTFVQDFYDWYVAKNKEVEGKAVPETPFEQALVDKKAQFDSALLTLLKDDLEASSRSPDEIVGLDFDPFLNTQDPKKNYVVGKAAFQGDRWRVEIFGLTEGKKPANPDVVAEAARRNGRWVFLNFHYGKSVSPENENLVSVLQALKRSRDQTKGR